MNDVNAKVYVAATDFGHAVQIAVTMEGPGILAAATVRSDGELSFDSVPKFTRITPTLVITREMATQLLQGLLELGIPTPTAGAIEGELKATKYHLEDLRRLIKIPKKPE